MRADSESLPLVSVVIPCYNQAEMVVDAVASACAQTYPNVEVLVVNDGSRADQDPAAAVAAFPGVRLIRKANGGVSSARNVGWRASRGEYLIFLDGDDLLLPDAAAVGARVLGEHPDCAFVHGLCDRRRLDGTLLEVRPPVVGGMDHYELLLRGNVVRGLHSVTFRRSAMEAVGGYDELQRFGNDWELYLRLARRFPAFGHGQLVATYRRHPGNNNSARNAARMLVASLEVLDKQREHVAGDDRLTAALDAGRQWARGIHGKNLAARVGKHARAGRWYDAWHEGWVLLRYDPGRALDGASQALRRVFRRPAPRARGAG